MAKAFVRLGTKLGGAIGQVQRTEYDAKVRDGIIRFDTSKDQVEKMIDRVKEVTPSISGLTQNEKLSQTLKQTASLYGESPAPYTALTDALQLMGQEDRKLDKNVIENCRTPLDQFVKVDCATFYKEKSHLDTRTLDMDGAKNENQKKPSDEAAQKEQETTLAYNQQKKIVEAMIDKLPTHYSNQAAALKTYAKTRAEYHQNVVKILNAALASM